MALTVVEPAAIPPAEPFEPPPDVVTTPCDPWPRPYFLKDGLRRVLPYHYTYNTYCKERWRDRGLLEIFIDEFRDRSPEYYEDAIKRGLIVLNGKQVATDTIVRNGDVVSHTCHRHEPPVTASTIGVVHEDSDMMVINKPAGVPVHPAGRYHYNSVVEIIRAERGFGFNPSPCNRLDRLTSGVMFIGKSPAAADRFTKQIMERTVRKEYVARVVGEFPEGDVICEQPILQISPKLGLNRVRANGKAARTVFKRLAYYPAKDVENVDSLDTTDESVVVKPSPSALPWRKLRGYSIVRCLPLTGRTHQIRVHLQFLGHPISNDPIYASQRVFGAHLAAGDSTATNDEDIISRLSRMGKDQVADAVAYHDEISSAYHLRKAELETGERCEVCDSPLYSDPGEHELGIYLHAKRYSSPESGWSYETELPGWALPPPGVSGPVEATEETDPLAVAESLQKLDLAAAAAGSV